MGEKKARRDTGSKVGAAIVQCGEEEEKEDDGRAEGEGTVLCRAARFPRSEAQHSAVSECVASALRTAAGVGSRAAAALRRAILGRLRFAGSGRAGTRARNLPSPACPASLPAVSPKGNGRILVCTS